MASKTNIRAQIHLLDLAARGSLGDEYMYAVMNVMFASTPGVVTIDSSHVGVVVNGKNTTDMEGLASLFAGVSDEKVLVPINCNGNHWCAIMIDLSTESIYTYDPMSSSYAASVRAVAHKLVGVLPIPKDRYHHQSYASSIGIQTDNYNCGIYVLLAFEAFTGASDVGYVNKQRLQLLRYRYLCMSV
eukprot:jgi/Phyca11/116822/e_gw1.31.388.1